MPLGVEAVGFQTLGVPWGDLNSVLHLLWAVSTKETALHNLESSVCLSICLCIQPPLHRAET